jgi:hypothetical protein
MARTTPKGTRPRSAKQHRLVRTTRSEMKQLVPGIELPDRDGSEIFRCSCANGPVWTGTREEIEEKHREHVATQNPEHPHPEDDIVEEPDGTVTVRYGFASRGGQPAHRGEITYASKAEYDAALESGLHDKHRNVRWYGALASNRGDTVIGEIIDENPHPDEALAGVHSADDPANRFEAEPAPAGPEPLRRRFLDPDGGAVVMESVDEGASWQIVEASDE